MLVIIDDVWQLEQVQALRVGGHHCAHLVTTRFPAIAAHLAFDGALMIEELDQEQSLQLLNRAAEGRVSHESNIRAGSCSYRRWSSSGPDIGRQLSEKASVSRSNSTHRRHPGATQRCLSALTDQRTQSRR